MNFDNFIYCLSFVAPLVIGIIIFVLRGNLKLSAALSIISVSIAIFSTYKIWQKISQEGLKYLQPHKLFYIDGFSILMQFMVEFVSIFVILFSLKEISKLYSHRNDKFHAYFSILMFSLGFMNLAFSLDNLFFLYIPFELSSIFVVYLISFNLDKNSLRAGFIYLLMVNVGILFSLLGIVLINYHTGTEVTISNISQSITFLNKNMALLCAAFFIIGFFTKAGLLPFHLWLPPAYAEAPSAITVFLAGAVTKMGFYGLVRTVTVFAFNMEEVKILVLLLSSLSIFLGAILAFNQKDIKKLIAYCSISEMGFIASALILDSYTAKFAGLFHLFNHTLMKGALFFAAGALIYLYGSRKIEEIRAFHPKAPAIMITFFIGALAVGGMPPFSSFLSSLSIIFALVDEKFVGVAFIMSLSGLISLLALLRSVISIFWLREENHTANNNVSLPVILVICALFFSIVLIALGIYPEFLHNLFHRATLAIININH